MIGGILGAITWVIPTEIIDAIEFFFAKIHYWDWIFPVDEIMTVIGYAISLASFYYTVKLILWLYHLVRHGGNTETPKLEYTAIGMHYKFQNTMKGKDKINTRNR